MQQNPVLIVASVNHLVPNTMQRRRNHSCYMCYVMMVVALWGQGDVTYNYNSNFIQALALSHLGLIPQVCIHTIVPLKLTLIYTIVKYRGCECLKSCMTELKQMEHLLSPLLLCKKCKWCPKVPL